MGSKYKKFIFVSIALILVSVCAFYSGLTTKNYTVKTNKLNAGSVVRIALIADLHSTIYGKAQQPLIQKIKRQNSDLILLAGDIVDDYAPIEGTKLLLDGIRDTAPIYYVTGNHEYWSNDIQTIRDELQSYGVKILSDTFEYIEVNGNKIIVVGVEDPDKKRYESPDYNQAKAMNGAFGDIDTFDAYKILLAHRPERIEQYAEYPFDLVVSGHAHGGQARIPFILNGLIAPNQGWFPKYAGGVYEHGKLLHIVSRGLSINPRLPRIFNPPELVIITLGEK